MVDASRRALLAGGGLVAATLALAPSADAASGLLRAHGADVPAAPLRSRFTALHGRSVTLRGPGGSSRAVVTDVADLVGARAGDAHRYSLLLKPAASLPDGIYRVSGRGLSSAALFLANVDRRRASGLEAIVCTTPA